MKITLIRHGIAEDKNIDQADFDRALTVKGCKKLLKNVESYYDELQSIDMIICSPSLRTRQTCAVLCSLIDIQPKDIVYDKRVYYSENNYQSLLTLIDEYTGTHTHVCLIGHNNAISSLASHLSGEEIMMKKGEIRSYEL